MPHESKGRLLVVDDDLVARQTLNELLSQEGYEVRYAPDGRTALMFAEADPPELILLDVRLPDLDGFEICRRLKESEKTGRIPVVFLSGLDDLGDKIKGIRIGGQLTSSPSPSKPPKLWRGWKRTWLSTACGMQADTQNIVLEAMVQERTRELTDLTESLVREINQREKIGEALEERLRFERLLSDLSARFVNVTPEQARRGNRACPEDGSGFFPGRAMRADSVIAGTRPHGRSAMLFLQTHIPPVPVGD